MSEASQQRRQPRTTFCNGEAAQHVTMGYIVRGAYYVEDAKATDRWIWAVTAHRTVMLRSTSLPGQASCLLCSVGYIV